MAAAEMQREWQLEDREYDEKYNREQLDETREYSRQVYSQLVEDAEKAGFNPLTALRNGGGASYNSAAGLAPLSSTTVTRQAPTKQAVGGTPLGDAVSGIGDFMANFDPHADTKREQEYRLVESQISALNASALSGSSVGSGSFAQSDFERRPSGQAASLSKVEDVRPMFTRWSDMNGKVHYLPNPDLPDLDQMVVPSIGVVANETGSAVSTAKGWADTAWSWWKSSPSAPLSTKPRVIRKRSPNLRY